MAVIITQDGYPELPEPDSQRHPGITANAELHSYLSDLIRALTDYFIIQKTDADTLSASTNYVLSVYAAGTVYSLTNTAALLNFGTTDPSLTIDTAGTYLIRARANLLYNGATFAANQAVTIKLRRTNNTAADLTNGAVVTTTGVVTLETGTLATPVIDVVYTTTNSDDVIQLFGSVATAPSAGSLDAVEASIVATRLY